MATAATRTPSERKKMIVAVVLGAIAVISLGYMYLGSSSSPSQSGARPGASPRGSVNPTEGAVKRVVTEEEFIPVAVPLDITIFNLPEASRNIFAFYVPPPRPTPTPAPAPTPVPPVPPNLILSSISPVNVFSRSEEFTLDVTGDKFTPETRIYIGGAEMPTRFVTPQQLSTKVPAQLISFEGGRDVKVSSRDGKFFSNTATLNVMPAPVPNFTLIGVILRPGSNDTAILKEKNTKDLINVQRGDVVGARFRVTSISVREVKLTDTTLKIKHALPLTTESTNPGAQPRYTPPPVADDNEP